MSKTPPNATAELLKALEAIATPFRQESERRAALTPEQRQAEDAGRARQAATDNARRQAARIRKASARFTRHDSFTLAEFAALLHGAEPANAYVGQAATRDSLAVLQSCVSTNPAPDARLPLIPVNIGVAPADWRFPRQALMQLALDKKLGDALPLAQALGFDIRARMPKVSAPPNEPSTLAPSPRAPKIRTPAPPPWHEPTRAFLQDLEAAARSAGWTFNRKRLPFSMKQLHTEFVRRNPSGNVKPSTWRKFVNELGFHGTQGLKPNAAGETLTALLTRREDAQA